MVGTPSLRRLRQSTSGPSTSEPSPSRQKHLHVTVVKALGLQLGDHHHSELGPYVSLRLKEDKWKTNNNRHDRKNENPEWNDSYTFRVENPLTDVLTLQVKMKLMVGQPRHIGKCLAIPLRDLPPEEARNMKVDTGEGKVCLTVRAMGFGNRQSPMHAHTNRDSGRSPAHFPSPNFQSPHRTSGQFFGSMDLSGEVTPSLGRSGEASPESPDTPSTPGRRSGGALQLDIPTVEGQWAPPEDSPPGRTGVFTGAARVRPLSPGAELVSPPARASGGASPAALPGTADAAILTPTVHSPSHRKELRGRGGSTGGGSFRRPSDTSTSPSPGGGSFRRPSDTSTSPPPEGRSTSLSLTPSVSPNRQRSSSSHNNTSSHLGRYTSSSVTSTDAHRRSSELQQSGNVTPSNEGVYGDAQEFRGSSVLVQSPGKDGTSDEGMVQMYSTDSGLVKFQWLDVHAWLQAGKVFKKNSWGTHYKVRIPPENPWMQVTLLKELGPAQWRRWVASMNDLAASPHRTLVRPIGHSQSGDVHAVVQVYYGVGTLQDVLDDPQLTWKMRLTVARTVAEGVAWMHTALAPPMFHGMLAAKSVTITEQWHAKLGNVGVKYLIGDEKEVAALSCEDDVENMGLIFLQLLFGVTGKQYKGRALADVPPKDVPNNFDWPKTVHTKMHALALKCVDPRQRKGLTADDLVRSIQKLVELGGFAPKDCMICMDASRSVLLECGHCATCEDCTQDMLKTDPHCPLCRQPFTRMEICDGSQTFFAPIPDPKSPASQDGRSPPRHDQSPPPNRYRA